MDSGGVSSISGTIHRRTDGAMGACHAPAAGLASPESGSYPKERPMAGRKFKWMLLFAAFAAAAGAHAQQFPAKPVRIVVGFAAGGSTDKLARVLATRMSELLGQS